MLHRRMDFPRCGWLMLRCGMGAAWPFCPYFIGVFRILAARRGGPAAWRNGVAW
jgi:hypothetical protein